MRALPAGAIHVMDRVRQLTQIASRLFNSQRFRSS